MLRIDQKIVADLVTTNAKVIDIGCGEGELLAHLVETKNINAHGLEIESERVAKAVAQELSVIQGDADTDLVYYPDHGFDIAILALTLQITKHPKDVLIEIMRIAKRAIVVIPNFGHLRNRLYITYRGRMPVNKSLSYEWYDTPNIHFCTIKDFISLAEEIGCTIEKKIYIMGNTHHPFVGYGSFNANLFGDQGIFVLSKKLDKPATEKEQNTEDKKDAANKEKTE